MQTITIFMNEQRQQRNGKTWKTVQDMKNGIIERDTYEKYTSESGRNFFESIGGHEWYRKSITPIGTVITATTSTSPDGTEKIRRTFNITTDY